MTAEKQSRNCAGSYPGDVYGSDGLAGRFDMEFEISETFCPASR